MLMLAARRLASMLLIMAVVSFILFIFETDKLGVAGKVLGPYSTVEQRELWLEQNGYNRPFLVRYVEWVGNALRATSATRSASRRRSTTCSGTGSANTGILALCVFAIMIPLSLCSACWRACGRARGLDRGISFLSILTTSVPEFASATFLVALFVFKLGWLPGTSSMTGGFNPVELSCRWRCWCSTISAMSRA